MLAPQEPLPSDNASCPSPSRPSSLSNFAETAKSDRLLERFKVPDHIAARVPQEDMRSAVESVFTTLGMSEADAAAAADVLIYADIRAASTRTASPT